MKTLEGKTAIVTGGTGGLGKGVLRIFLENGCNVFSTYIVDEELDEIRDIQKEFGSKLFLSKIDVTDEKQVSSLLAEAKEKFGKIDILLNLVGGFHKEKIVDTDSDVFEKMISMNLRSCFVCSKIILPHFIENNYGKIVNIAAKPALKSYSGMSAYGAGKAGVVALTETVADEVKDYDINVNAIVPGTIDTEQNREDMKDADFSKWVKPEELAKIMLFLVSEDSKLINGAVIPALGKS